MADVPSEWARLLDFAERPRAHGWSLRAALTRYAQGQPHTAIAQRLGLTPATVRTYLRDAYAQLGVRNKIELLAALNGGDR